MERLAAATTVSPFERWEEVFVSSDKGRREVRYYLKRRDGSSDLAVIGKEKSLRHMSYHYAFRDRSFLSILPHSSLLKLRSRREVVDWLNSLVSDLPTHRSFEAVGGSLDRKDACKLDVESFKAVQLRNIGHYTTEIVWLGSPWTCKKRRRHYESFRRNGVKISVNDFVYVLAEEHKRLVAYIDDMYEDSRGNKMVVVRWFHKIDEVGIVLPQHYNDREIFFSLCLQDLSIECIDGLAIVLSPQHYDRFLNEAKHTRLEPFVCRRQFDDDDNVKPFDVTQIKGYWRQELLTRIFTSSPSKDALKYQNAEDGLKAERNVSDRVVLCPKKRLRRSEDGDRFAAFRSVKQGVVQEPPPQRLTIGSQVEVLSQDSGLRGCWFRAVVIKKHKDKIKVQYQDIKDAADETNSLEEWVLASKVLCPDPLGLRMCGRTSIRPTPLVNERKVSVIVNVGMVVDVWWHDGWWEGIVIKKEMEDKIRVYFPGENKDSIFGSSDLRRSQEWFGNRWEDIKERQDLVTSILSNLELKSIVPIVVKTCDVKLEKTAMCHGRSGRSKSQNAHIAKKVKELQTVHDLSKDAVLTQLKWMSSGKRKRGKNSVQKLNYIGYKRKSSSTNSPETGGNRTFHSFFLPKSRKVDRENCKYIGDSPFGSSVLSPLTSLVMSS
ncbi:hypothetical protein U1Q18_042788 [Sarracenia purpurea var. burkii]